jgi:NAD(P)-dependent dehydrogenase (short-subunit alcohol dehydrogenase family)
MLTMCMAAEWAPYGCVNVAGPSSTGTYFSRPLRADAERTEEYLSAVPNGRVADPEDIVGRCSFLSLMGHTSVPDSLSVWTADSWRPDLF